MLFDAKRPYFLLLLPLCAGAGIDAGEGAFWDAARWNSCCCCCCLVLRVAVVVAVVAVAGRSSCDCAFVVGCCWLLLRWCSWRCSWRCCCWSPVVGCCWLLVVLMCGDAVML